MAHSVYPNPLQWPIAQSKICRSRPDHRKTLEFEFLGEFESVFETALDPESEDLMGTFGEITLDKKFDPTVALRHCGFTSVQSFGSHRHPQPHGLGLSDAKLSDATLSDVRSRPCSLCSCVNS